MKTLFSIIFFFLCFYSTNCVSTKQPCSIECLSVLYDDETVLRIASPTSNDLIRWELRQNMQGLSRMTVSHPDSIALYEALLRSMRVDTTIIIKTVLEPTFGKIKTPEFDMTYSYYDSTNDIPADAMIVYHYRKHCRDNDTLFAGVQDGHIVFRLNSHRASGDFKVWERIRQSYPSPNLIGTCHDDRQDKIHPEQ